MTKATKALTSLFRLLEKYHYAINKPIYCPVKTKKKKLCFQRPSKLKGILLWTTLFFVYQCWTEGRSSTAVAEDLRPTATATVAEV